MQTLSLVRAANCCLWTRKQAESEYFTAAGTVFRSVTLHGLLSSFLPRVNLGKIGDQLTERRLWCIMLPYLPVYTPKHTVENPGIPWVRHMGTSFSKF